MNSTDNRRIAIAVWDLPNGETARVSVSFPTFADMAKVYALHVQPMRLEQYDGHTIERYEPRRGYRTTLETAPRYSRKRLEAIAEDPATFERARGMFARVVADSTPTTAQEG
jgi:hypothetical protein